MSIIDVLLSARIMGEYLSTLCCIRAADEVDHPAGEVDHPDDELGYPQQTSDGQSGSGPSTFVAKNCLVADGRA